MKYVVWSNDEDDGLAWIRFGIKGELGTNSLRLNEGEPCKSWFPKRLVLEVETPRGDKLADSIPNTDGWIVVSEKLKGFIEGDGRLLGTSAVEFLPVEVKNRKGKATPYWIANVLCSYPCLDRRASKFEEDSFDDSRVEGITRLVLDRTKIPGDATLFRLAEMPDLILVREDVARLLTEGGYTGMRLAPLEDFGKEFHGKNR